jgi:phytoene dehydrogenase-like protein
LSSPSTYDAIILGAGHNGLVCAAYLAHAGQRVLVLDRRDRVGGAATTEEIHPGFRASTAAYLVSLFQPKIVADLDLHRHGYEVMPKDPAYFAPFPDGRAFFMWRDMGRTQAEIANLSRRDAEQYPAYEAFLDRVAERFTPWLLRPPPRPGQLFDGDPEMWRMVTGSVKDLLDDWFESDKLKVALASDGVVGHGGGPRTPGTAYVLLHHQMGGVGGSRGLWGFVRGGTGALSEAIAASARTAGAEIKLNAEVAEIVVRDGAAVGVALASGDECRAPIVVSNATPKRTFLELLDSALLPDDFRAEVERFKSHGYVFKVNLALDGVPEFTAAPGREIGSQHRGTVHICPDVDYMERAWDEAKYGRPASNPTLELTIPTAYDPSLAPPGKHVVSIFAQYAPYQLAEGDWDSQREAFADRVVDVLADYAPNVKSLVVGRKVYSPLDLERAFGLTGGHIFHGELSPDQLLGMRFRYETPIRGLYLCGSGTHPGGGVMGAPGHNAAHAILASRVPSPSWKGTG